MSNRTADIQRILTDQDPEFRQWAEEHRTCETRLHELTPRHEITTDEEIEEKTLKKRKLHLKDQMAERIRSYESAARRRLDSRSLTPHHDCQSAEAGFPTEPPLHNIAAMTATWRSKRVRPNFRRGVYVIPTSLTILNLFFGFRAIIYATRAIEAIAAGRTDAAVDFFETACLSLLFAAVFDTFDGMIARAAQRHERVRQGVRLARRRGHVRRGAGRARLRVGPARLREARRRHRLPLPRRRVAASGALQRA